MMLLIIVGILLLISVYAISNNNSENFHIGDRYKIGSNFGGCEYNRECSFNNARTIAMSDGSEGVCVDNSMACPSFMLDKNYWSNVDNPVSYTPSEIRKFMTTGSF